MTRVREIDEEMRDALARARALEILSSTSELYYVHRAPGGNWQVGHWPVPDAIDGADEQLTLFSPSEPKKRSKKRKRKGSARVIVRSLATDEVLRIEKKLWHLA